MKKILLLIIFMASYSIINAVKHDDLDKKKFFTNKKFTSLPIKKQKNKQTNKNKMSIVANPETFILKDPNVLILKDPPLQKRTRLL